MMTIIPKYKSCEEKEKSVFYECVRVLGIYSNIWPAGPSVLPSHHHIIFTGIRVVTEKVKEGDFWS